MFALHFASPGSLVPRSPASPSEEASSLVADRIAFSVNSKNNPGYSAGGPNWIPLRTERSVRYEPGEAIELSEPRNLDQ